MEIAFQVELELGIVSFCGGWKTGELGEKPSEEGRERTTNSAHIWRQVQESNLGQSSGSRALSQLRRPHSSFAQFCFNLPEPLRKDRLMVSRVMSAQ